MQRTTLAELEGLTLVLTDVSELALQMSHGEIAEIKERSDGTVVMIVRLPVVKVSTASSPPDSWSYAYSKVTLTFDGVRNIVHRRVFGTGASGRSADWKDQDVLEWRVLDGKARVDSLEYSIEFNYASCRIT